MLPGPGVRCWSPPACFNRYLSSDPSVIPDGYYAMRALVPIAQSYQDHGNGACQQVRDKVAATRAQAEDRYVLMNEQCFILYHAAQQWEHATSGPRRSPRLMTLGARAGRCELLEEVACAEEEAQHAIGKWMGAKAECRLWCQHCFLLVTSRALVAVVVKTDEILGSKAV